MKRLVLNHRGCFNNVNVIENTIKAFKNKLKDGFELDVQLTKDNVLVCYHDKTLERLHGNNNIIRNQYYNNLQQYSIDRLEDVFIEFDDSVFIDIEMKNYDYGNGYVKTACSEVGRLINKYKKNNILVTSFDTNIIKESKTHPYKSTRIFDKDVKTNEISTFLRNYPDSEYIVVNKTSVYNKIIPKCETNIFTYTLFNKTDEHVDEYVYNTDINIIIENDF
jgi:glycerophosphoryl diester phosphodiesterase